MVHLQCICGQRIELPESHIGKAGSCKSCKRVLRAVAADLEPETDNWAGLLVIRRGPGRRGEQIYLGGQLPIEIGKLPGTSILLGGDKVSRTHCRLTRTESGWRIEDQESTNGVFVNGRRVSLHDLRSGDLIRIGEFELKYMAGSAADLRAGRRRAVDRPPVSPPVAPAQKPPPVPTAGRATAPPTQDDAGRATVEPDDGLYAIADNDLAELAAGGEIVESPAHGGTADERGGRGISSPDHPTSPGGTDGAGYTSEELVAIGQAVVTDVKPSRGFWSSVLWSFLLFTALNNIIMLMVIWFLHALLPVLGYAGCLGLVGQIIVGGWLCSYWLSVIQESAGGEDRLPTLSLTEGLFQDAVVPLVKFAVATLLAWTPAIVCAIAVSLILDKDPEEIAANPTVTVVITVAVSMFLWPMLLLVIAVGGFSSILRMDLIAKTIVRTFLPYLAVVTLFAATWALETFADELAVKVIGGGLQNFWITNVVSALAAAYFSIVSMWIVGLYYHHFKGRFAWSWG